MSWTRRRSFLSVTANRLSKCQQSSRGSQNSSSIGYCSDLVRKHDHESFLCSLLLPNDVRRAAFAIRAFSTELALIRDIVSTPALGAMRLQFWKDTLDQIFKDHPPQQPVAQELAWVLRSKKLSQLWLRKLIESREQTLTDHPHHSLNDFETYCHNSVSATYYLILEVAGVRDVNADHLADHAGKAQGLSYLLRGIPFNASKGRVLVPTHLLAKHSVSQEDFLRKKHEDKLKEVVFEIASAAHAHMEMVSSLQSSIPKDIRKIFLPTIPCKVFLKQLQRRDFDIFHSDLYRRDQLLPLRLWWTVKVKGTTL